jgi:hypothetical protein
LFVCLSVCLSVCLFVCLFVFLLCFFLISGNTEVQSAVYDYVVRVDRDARVFKHLRSRLTAAMQVIDATQDV